ncbi:MAG: helix-turn-helix transcriptional regulator, partial [Gammaproteobacteria bacterium]|nr:helix-turn-helix transcriptional regulator [Gammaproteobacteria bacterium]
LQRIVIPASEIENYFVHMALIGTHTLVVFVVLVRTLSRDGAHLLQLRVDDPGATTTTWDRGNARASSEGGAESKGPVDTLVRLLEVDHIYRRPKLSIRSLADELALPEYRLRKLIHEELGFRNFNTFLHHYRLREACGMLSDPSQARTPILTIALTVGYQSINTFNRAFREIVGETPSTFRARSLGGPDG